MCRYQKKEPVGSRRTGVGSCSHIPMDLREQKLKLVDLRKAEVGAWEDTWRILGERSCRFQVRSIRGRIQNGRSKSF